jgi:hypothetical protein
MKFVYALFALSALGILSNAHARDETVSYDASHEIAEAPRAPAMDAADAEKLIQENPPAAGIRTAAKSPAHDEDPVPLADYNSRPWPPD